MTKLIGYLFSLYFLANSKTINSQAKTDLVPVGNISDTETGYVNTLLNVVQGSCLWGKPGVTPLEVLGYTTQLYNRLKVYREAMEMKQKLDGEIRAIFKASMDHSDSEIVFNAIKGELQDICLIQDDCSTISPSQTGVYQIYTNDNRYIKVLCNMDVDGGNWTVIQRRQDGSVDFFNRTWQEYKEGFGNLDGEFWLGNENIHQLTSAARYELRVDLQDYDDNTWYAQYKTFQIGSEAEKYRLTVGGYSGTAGDSLKYHNEMKFSTKDQDNDEDSGSCSNVYKGAWWYKNCHYSNLNGLYQQGDGSHKVTWYHVKNKHFSMKFTRMMIRPY